MPDTRTRPRATAAGATALLAGSSAVAFGVGDALRSGTDSVEALTWVLGWVLLVWTLVVGAIAVVHLLDRLASGVRPTRTEVLLLATAAALVVAVIWTHPLVGSGSGSA